MKKRTIFAYLIAAGAGLGFIWVPDDIFYDHPELFFIVFVDNSLST